MNSKALFYLLITLFIGFALGMITDRALRVIGQSRMAHGTPPERNIMDDIITTLELRADQIDSIKPVINDFFNRAEITRNLIMKQAEADMDTLRLNLLPYLTEAQIEKIEDLGLFRPGPRRGFGPRPGIDRRNGPPPGDRRSPEKPYPPNHPRQ